jgi:hypothetical protein
MRIAMCMYGKAGGTKGKNGLGETVDLEACYRSYKKRIFLKNPPIDVFIHCWSPEERDRIDNLFKPTVSFYQNPITFSDDMRVNLTTSRWFSTNQSLLFKSNYELMTGNFYDCVMVNRFDGVFHKDLVFANHDMRFFWAGRTHGIAQPGDGKKAGLWLQDFWFFSNSAIMDYLGTMHENLPSRNSHKGVYAHIIKRGIEIKYTMECPRDFDLYRWWAKTSDDWPRKWYNLSGSPHE